MPLNVRHPVWLATAPRPGIRVFAMLYLVETVARASISSVIPLQAYDLLADESAVSFLYSAVGIAGLTAGFLIPLVIRRITRRWTYTLGALCMIAGGLALASFTVPGQGVGMFLRTFGTACLNITLNLYVMEFIRRHDYVRNEATRLALSSVGWAVGPFFGVWLYTEFGIWAAHGWSIAWAVALIGVFWYLRFTEAPVFGRQSQRAPRPWENIRRFLAQPRLRLAWAVAFARSAFWSGFFIYVPIMMVAGGESKMEAALVVSLGNAVLITTLVWQRVAGRAGLRRGNVTAFLLMVPALAAAGALAGSNVWAAAACILVAAAGASGLDALATPLFFRAVRKRERAEMTSVYRTYLDSSELIPPLIYGILLTMFPLGVVFYLQAALCLASAALVARYVHPRL